MTVLLKSSRAVYGNSQGVLGLVCGRGLQLQESSFGQNIASQSSQEQQYSSQIQKDSLKQANNKQIQNALAKAQYSTKLQKGVISSEIKQKTQAVPDKKDGELSSLQQSFNNIVRSPWFKAAASISPLGLVGSFSAADVPEKWQMGLQDPATPFMQNAIDVHMETMTLVCFMIGLCYYLLGRITLRFFSPPGSTWRPGKTVEHPLAETVWTLLPVFTVVVLAVSAFGLIYSEELMDTRESYTGLTVKVIGRQWYWSYFYPSFMEDFEGDSYIQPDDELESGQFRCLEVDNRMVLPTNTPIRFVITSSDVIHSWSVPSFGIKCDAVPGRLNTVTTLIKRPGIFYGQCSELCGVQHFGMPICVVAIPPDDDLWQ